MSEIAFLGLGAMGSRMARRLVDAGHSVRVWNRTPAAADELVRAGAATAARSCSVAILAGSSMARSRAASSDENGRPRFSDIHFASSLMSYRRKRNNSPVGGAKRPASPISELIVHGSMDCPR